MSEISGATPAAGDFAAWARHLPGTDVERVVAELGTGSLPGAMRRAAHRRPRHPALLFPAESAKWIDHGELAERVARTGGWLVRQGLRPGERVVVCGHNTASTVIAYLAVLGCGGTVVLANPAYTSAELDHLLTDSGACWAFAAEPAAESLRLEYPDVRTLSLDAALPESSPVEVAEPRSDEPAMLAYTSGTTGAPKGVVLTHGNLLASIRAAMAAWGWSEDEVLVHCLPLSHQHGLGGVHATLLAGSSAVILPRFEPSELVEALRTHRASVLFAVPAIYERLVEQPDLTEVALRLAVSGSAPLDAGLAHRIADILGEIPLERYGSTESGLDVSNPLDGPRLPGTVGIPLPGVELRIVDESGAALPAEHDGEIVLRGPQVFSEYWNRPEATREAFLDGGWFRTGDIGRIDANTGHLTITGRKKELIITGGMNVYPREVELALERHPSVAEAAVAGVPSQRWGEEVTAWVVADGAVAADELIEHARGLLAGYKCPKRVLFVDALPRNSMGKLQRSTLVADAVEPNTAVLDRAVAKLSRADLS